MGWVKRIWYLSPMRAAKVQASLRMRTVSPEPPLLAHTSNASRGTFRQKARSLALLNGWACAVKICRDGLLEDTNSPDAPQLIFTVYGILSHKTRTFRTALVQFVEINMFKPKLLHSGIRDGQPTSLVVVSFGRAVGKLSRKGRRSGYAVGWKLGESACGICIAVYGENLNRCLTIWNRGRFRQIATSLTPLNGCACAFE